MRLGRVTAAAVALTALVAGCSGGEQANETLPSSSSAAAETTESLPPLGPPDFPMPAEARQQTEAGAEAALRYFLELTSHQAGKSGEPLRELSADCELCDMLADRYDADATAGYQVAGGEYIVESFSTSALGGDVAEFALTVTQTAVVVTDASGIPVPERGSPAISGLSLGASMTWSEQGQFWVANQIVRNN